MKDAVRGSEASRVDDLRQVFRCLLEATSCPGTVRRLPLTRLSPPAPWSSRLVQVAMTLLDRRTSFSVRGNETEALTRYLRSNTSARAVEPAEADYVVLGTPLAGLDVWSLSRGEQGTPHGSSTIVAACRYLIGEDGAGPADKRAAGAVLELIRDGAEVLAIGGRGILGHRLLVVDSATARLTQRLAAREDEYPFGIDLILVDGAGGVVSIPRTARCRREALLRAANA